MKNTLDNYNFEAYIPTLIPLLTGDNIYSSKVVFARELIQNSIDAISVREAKEEREFSKEILIRTKYRWKMEEDILRLQIVAQGWIAGSKIERYFYKYWAEFLFGGREV